MIILEQFDTENKNTVPLFHQKVHTFCNYYLLLITVGYK